MSITERRIVFDLTYFEPKCISEIDLESLAKHLKFESILQYVKLPRLSVEPRLLEEEIDGPVETGGSEEVDASEEIYRSLLKSKPRKGLDDFKIIFDWLWKNGVRRILEVVVDDDRDIPHSDEIIEKALQKFHVEVWRWKKFDLCSETIFKAAPDVRKISLYSNGNNAVLRSWSCKDGLAKLKKV